MHAQGESRGDRRWVWRGRFTAHLGRGVAGLIILLAFTVLGEDARRYLHLPLPGAVVGLALLAVALGLIGKVRAAWARRAEASVEPVARLFLRHMGLLFVPAGVGVIDQYDALRREWVPISVAVAASTLAGLAVTGWLMHRASLGERKP